MAKIISIHSFRGGTGKSNMAANVATLLAAGGQRIGVVDTDIQSPGIHVLFGMTRELPQPHDGARPGRPDHRHAPRAQRGDAAFDRCLRGARDRHAARPAGLRGHERRRLRRAQAEGPAHGARGQQHADGVRLRRDQWGVSRATFEALTLGTLAVILLIALVGYALSRDVRERAVEIALDTDATFPSPAT